MGGFYCLKQVPTQLGFPTSTIISQLMIITIIHQPFNLYSDNDFPPKWNATPNGNEWLGKFEDSVIWMILGERILYIQ